MFSLKPPPEKGDTCGTCVLIVNITPFFNFFSNGSNEGRQKFFITLLTQSLISRKPAIIRFKYLIRRFWKFRMKRHNLFNFLFWDKISQLLQMFLYGDLLDRKSTRLNSSHS